MSERLLEHLRTHGIEDDGVLAAFRAVDRKAFLPESQYPNAEADSALPIGEGQTISQPSLVARMMEAAEVGPRSKVLEIGTGSGYQTALLAEICDTVYTVERIESLARQARGLLDRLGYDNVHYHIGDGWDGWEQFAPYDAIIVTAAPERVPEKLVDQLATGGRMVIPVGDVEAGQDLQRIRKTDTGTEIESLLPVRFVPMIKG